MPALRNDLAHESEEIRKAGIDGYLRLRETSDRADNEAAISKFLGVKNETAQSIMQLDYLFAD